MMKKKIAFKDMKKTTVELGRTELTASELKLVTGGAAGGTCTFCDDVDCIVNP